MNYNRSVVPMFGTRQVSNLYVNYGEENNIPYVGAWLRWMFKSSKFKIAKSAKVTDLFRRDEGSYDLFYLEERVKERKQYFLDHEGGLYKNDKDCLPIVFLCTLEEYKDNKDRMDKILNCGDTLAIHIIVLGDRPFNWEGNYFGGYLGFDGSTIVHSVKNDFIVCSAACM